MPDLIDFSSVDITILLSDRSVQQLLDIAEEHPDWSNRQIFAQHPKNAHGDQLLTYEQTLAILRRLRLHTVILRRLRQIAVDRWETTDKPATRKHLIDLFPDFLSYIQYR